MIEYSQGIVGRDSPFVGWKQSESWEKNVYKSISAGFYFQEASSETSSSQNKKAVNYIHSTIIARDIENRNLMNNPAERKVVQKDGDSCVPWQFVLDITDACVPSWELRTGIINCTSSIDEKPCCLPGFELRSGSIHGPCKLNSPCICSDEICNPVSPPTTFPSYIQTSSPTSIVPYPTTSIVPNDTTSIVPNATTSGASNSGKTVNRPIIFGLSFLAMTFLNNF